ncbi:uncharacterized protein METZ01_LOCUS368752 [marine metagenome]|uniref:Uncharacterized protein n=1 Tax=marine metagenome TaxID=408172 RepID=A0A382T3B2_9ZZZZ
MSKLINYVQIYPNNGHKNDGHTLIPT